VHEFPTLLALPPPGATFGVLALASVSHAMPCTLAGMPLRRMLGLSTWLTKVPVSVHRSRAHLVRISEM